MTSAGKIKIGLLLESLEMPAWVGYMLSILEQSEYASIDLVILNKTQAIPERTLARRVLENRNRFIYLIYDKIDKAVNITTPDAFADCDLAPLLAGAEMMEVCPMQTKYCDYINDNDVERIKAHKLDMLIRLGFRILKGEILTSAQYGIWSYHHADNRVNRGCPPGFWEVIERQAVTGTVLQILSEKLDDGMVLTRSFSGTDTLSVARNKNAFYWKSASLLPREIKSLHALGKEQYFLEKMQQEDKLVFYSNRMFTEPGNLEMARKIPGYCSHYLGKRIKQKFSYEHWFLRFRFNRDNEISTSFHQFTTLESPWGRFWADPCVVYESGKYYVFIEEYLYDKQKAHISVFEIDEKGKISKLRTIIEKPYHLSYPFLFKWQGMYYLIPESSENKTIEVYRCLDFPNHWELHKVIMDEIVAVDTTLFEYNEKWWMFTNIQEHSGASKHDELFLFYADTPLSDSWTAHPGNPVISDVRNARPAGRLFYFNDSIYRPSQDCSIEYGHGLVLNEILEMTETRYREKTIQHMAADWDNKITGIHTLSHARNLTFIDAKRRKLKFSV